MCGICGFVGRPDPELLVAMRDALAHRGPDDAGSFHDARVSLGIRRLSIVDLQGGHQPIFNEDRTIALAFNGEIYNHRALRAELERAGHRFATQADTESVVHAYEEWGDDCLDRLEGMFAFVLYDQRRQRLLAARDRFGEKPLYYTFVPEHRREAVGAALVFASELKSLRIHPAAAACREVRVESLISYLARDYVVGDASIWQGIERLPAAHAFTLDLSAGERESMSNAPRVFAYWDNRLAEPRGDQPAANQRQRVERGRAALRAAVESRLMSDVPLGVFLSGGIDSSTIVALLAQSRPGREIKTFSIGFDEPTFDESPFAREAARQFGTEHHERRFTTDELLAQLPIVVRQFDEPLADPSILPFTALCQFARGEVKVALGGDGGDEVFAGYDPLRALSPAAWYDRLVPPLAQRAMVQRLANWLPVGEGNLNWPLVARRFLRGAGLPLTAKLSAWMGAFDLPGLRRLLPGLAEQLSPEAVYAPEIAAMRRLAAADRLPLALDYFQRFYLPDDILVKVDRGSMAHSLEVRAPWLERGLVELLNRAGPERRAGKTWLKEVVGLDLGDGPLLPASIVERRKKGFGIPVSAWIRRPLRGQFEELLLEGWPRQLEMFDRQEIRRLLTSHLSGQGDHYKELWALFMLAHWAHAHGGG